MSESSSRSNLIKNLRSLDAFAIESPTTGLGIPDVGCTLGFIECKWMRAWPKRADTHPVKFPHPLSEEQKIWLWRHCRKGGLAMVCCQVSKDWFFFDGQKMKDLDLWDNMTRPQMKEWAEIYFLNGLKGPELIQFLKDRWRTLAMRNNY